MPEERVTTIMTDDGELITVCICMYVSTYVCINEYMCIYVYVYIYMCVCIYVCTYA
jgi:hypothetical protein